VESERKRQRANVDRFADTDRKTFKEAMPAPSPRPQLARAIAPLMPENQQPTAKPAKATKKAKPAKPDKKIKQGVIKTKADVKKLPREEKQIFDVHEEVRADSERKLLRKATFKASSEEDQKGVIMGEMKKVMCPSTLGAKSLFREDYATVTVELAMELRSRVRRPGRGVVEDMNLDESDADEADVEIVRLPLSKRWGTKKKDGASRRNGQRGAYVYEVAGRSVLDDPEEAYSKITVQQFYRGASNSELSSSHDHLLARTPVLSYWFR
jgi:hypothetical protein